MDTKQTYFVSKYHQHTRATLALLVDQLNDAGWHRVLNVQSEVLSFAQGSDTVHLCRTVEQWLGKVSSIGYAIDGAECSMSAYMAAEHILSQSKAVFSGVISTSRGKYLLVNTSNSVEIVANGEAVYAIVYGNADTHATVSEFFAECDDPQVLSVSQSQHNELVAWYGSSEEGEVFTGIDSDE